MNPDIDMRENDVYMRMSYREAGALAAVIESLLGNFQQQGTAESLALTSIIVPIHQRLVAMKEALNAQGTKQ